MNFFLERSSYNQYRTVLDEDDSIFFSFNSENGSRIVCKSAEEFKANLLDQDDGVYVVRKKAIYTLIYRIMTVKDVQLYRYVKRTISVELQDLLFQDWRKNGIN